MSCEDCEKAQERIFQGLDGIAYYRWKNANIGIIGCEKHISEVMEALNEKR